MLLFFDLDLRFYCSNFLDHLPKILLFTGQKFAMLEEKVVVSTIFRNFNVKSLQESDDLNPVAELILRPENGIIVALTPRN